jgi:TfoX/Sxy family transcriptional regulator of competence genes
MEIPKPSDADKDFFRSLVADTPGVEVKPMFGNLGAFVHGNMFAGLFGAAVGLRLSDADATDLRAVPGAGPFGPAERPMGGYTSIPTAWREEPDLIGEWVEKALEYVSTFPPKVPKPRKGKR